MMDNWLIQNAKIVNEGEIFIADLRICNGRIEKISKSRIEPKEKEKILDAEQRLLIPGMIDD